jgi:predicted dehydrogenase
MKFPKSIILFIISLLTTSLTSNAKEVPLRVGVVGLTHTHVHWILGSEVNDIEIVGIVEPNGDLAKRYLDMYGLSMDLVYDTMDEMIKKTKPEAVAAFGTIYDHLKVVETCAPKGIHVMVEKPLAVSLDHAKKMKSLAEKHDIHLLTNYETTWYPTNHEAYDMAQNNQLGDLRKIVVHDGHQGPEEIGVNMEFLEWLTDPLLNGGGAITDFGCYGANLVTWLMEGERPTSVFAVTQNIKPDIYTEVDDEATIVLTYPKTQAIIQASWNWPMSRKDMEVYGKTGYAIADNRSNLRYRLKESDPETKITLEERPAPFNDPFVYLAAIIRNKIEVNSYNLSSLENNIVVMEILEAAKESAKTGKVVYLK